MCVSVAQSCPTLSDPMDCSQAPLSMGFPRQEYWSGLPCPSPRDLPRLGIEPSPLPWQVDSFTAEPGKPEPYTMGCLVDTETPHQVIEVNYIMM